MGEIFEFFQMCENAGIHRDKVEYRRQGKNGRIILNKKARFYQVQWSTYF